MLVDNDPVRADAAADTGLLADFRPVPVVHRRTGWTAERQRIFLTTLAETGSISEASGDAGVSARSAYRLRARPDAAGFARAWDHALRLATIRLTTIAFERAVKGTVREVWRDGELVGETRTPNDRLLMFLLHRLMPAGAPDARWAGLGAMVDAAAAAFPRTLDALADHDVAMVDLHSRDFLAVPPGDPRDDA